MSPPTSRLCGWQDEPSVARMVARTRQQRWSQEQSQATAHIGEDSPHPERNLVRQQRDFDPMVQEMRERCVGTEQTAAVAAILECTAPCPAPCKAAEEARQMEPSSGDRGPDALVGPGGATTALCDDLFGNERSKSPGCTGPRHEPEDRDWRGIPSLARGSQCCRPGNRAPDRREVGAAALGQQTWNTHGTKAEEDRCGGRWRPPLGTQECHNETGAL